MKVLMVGLDLNPPWVEGIRNSTRLISLNLIKYGHEVHILTKGYDNQPEAELIEGMHYHRVFIGHPGSYYTSGVFTFLFKLPIKLMKAVKQGKIDVVHGHSVYAVFGIILGIVSTIARVKSVFTLYSSIDGKETINQPQKLMNTLLNLSKSKLLARMLPIFVNRVIVTSDKAEESLLSIGINRAKIRHIPVGIDLSLFKPLNESGEVRDKLNMPREKKIVLFAGDITPWKGLEVFLKAISIIYKRHLNIVCVIMTKNTYKYERERREQADKLINAYGIGESIHFIGRYSDIKEIFGISDVVVLPFVSLSLFMDTPLALLEAMAMGKAVVTSKVGSLGDTISSLENGLLVKPNNENELADAIVRLLSDDDLCKRLGENARSYIQNSHDINAITGKVEELYSELLDVGH